MSKYNRKGLKPELRFPEFGESGEWKLTPLKKLAISCTEKNRDGSIVRVLTNSAQHGIVDQRDYFDKDIAVQGNLEGYFIVEKGDFVYNPRISSMAPVGPISKNNIATGVMSPLYTVFRFKFNNDDFYAHYFKTTCWHYYMRQVSSTGARHDRMAISKSDFIAMPIPIPPVEQEQQKIAECLSSLDELITAHTQKHQELQSYKKGLMQNLFPAEYETVPALRFPEFLHAGDWRKAVLGEVATFSKGKGISKADIEVGGKLPCIRYGELYTLYGETIEEVVSFTNVSLKNLVLSKKNDVIIPASGETQEDIATASCVKKEGVALGGDLNIIRSKIKGVFLSYYLNSVKKYEIAHMAQGISVIHLYPAQLKGLEIYFPQESSEQTKIADCLSSVDELITAQEIKIEELKVYKKGLMQQLFPAMDEVEA